MNKTSFFFQFCIAPYFDRVEGFYSLNKKQKTKIHLSLFLFPPIQQLVERHRMLSSTAGWMDGNITQLRLLSSDNNNRKNPCGQTFFLSFQSRLLLWKGGRKLGRNRRPGSFLFVSPCPTVGAKWPFSPLREKKCLYVCRSKKKL